MNNEQWIFKETTFTKLGITYVFNAVSKVSFNKKSGKVAQKCPNARH